MKYERSITSGLEVMAKVKVFVHATDADVDTDADGRAMTLAPRTCMSRLAKKSSFKSFENIDIYVKCTHSISTESAFLPTTNSDQENTNYTKLHIFSLPTKSSKLL